MFAPAARATFEANEELCSWMLNPLARWAQAAYGDRAFEDAAEGYAKYCLGVTEVPATLREGRQLYAREHARVMAEVYEDEGYMVPYMWAAILIYPFWPSMVNHIALYRDDFLKSLAPHARVLELASGHGVLSLLAAEERPDIKLKESI